MTFGKNLRKLILPSILVGNRTRLRQSAPEAIGGNFRNVKYAKALIALPAIVVLYIIATITALIGTYLSKRAGLPVMTGTFAEMAEAELTEALAEAIGLVEFRLAALNEADNRRWALFQALEANHGWTMDNLREFERSKQ